MKRLISPLLVLLLLLALVGCVEGKSPAEVRQYQDGTVTCWVAESDGRYSVSISCLDTSESPR